MAMCTLIITTTHIVMVMAIGADLRTTGEHLLTSRHVPGLKSTTKDRCHIDYRLGIPTILKCHLGNVVGGSCVGLPVDLLPQHHHG